MARKQAAEIMIPGGGQPPVFHGRGNPNPLIQLPTVTVARVMITLVRMRTGHRTSLLVKFAKSLKRVGLQSLSDVALVFLLELSNNLELWQSSRPEFSVVLECYFRKHDSGTISCQPRCRMVGS